MCVFRRTFYGKSYANSEDLGDQFRILLRGFLFHLDYLIESLRVTLMIIHLFGNYIDYRLYSNINDSVLVEFKMFEYSFEL